MFSAGEHIIYSIFGVCLVEKIDASPVDSSSEQLYYYLRPVSAKTNNFICIPKDNPSLPMRTLITEKELENLVPEIRKDRYLTVASEKNRRDVYKTAIMSLDPLQYLRLIFTVESRRESFFKSKKRLPETDIEFERTAKNSLYHEIELVRNIPFEQVNDYVHTLFAQPEE